MPTARNNLPTVVVVDDNRANLLAMEALLEPLPVVVVTALSAAAALSTLLQETSQRVALVVTDVKMPGMDGFEFLVQLKDNERTRRIPVLFYSGYGYETREARRAYELGAIDYVVKPVDPDVLRAKIRMLVRLSEQETKLAAQEATIAQLTSSEREGIFRVFDAAPVAVAILRGPEHQVVYVNEHYSRLTGRELHELLERPIRTCSSTAGAMAIVEMLDRVFQSGAPLRERALRVEWDRHRDGSKLESYFDWRCLPVYDAEGRTTGTAQFFFDVTSEVHADRALERAQLELEAALARETRARREALLRKEHLASVFMQAPMPIAVLHGPQLLIELANVHACTIWGRDLASIVDRPLAEALPEVKGQPFLVLLEGVLQSGKAASAREMPAKFDRRGNGALEEALLDFLCTPLRNVFGQVDRLLVVAMDVTDQVAARVNVERLRDEAEAANRAKDQFLAMLGHELRNPLSPIITALHLLRNRGTSCRELDIIERQVSHLLRLVDDLMDVARISKSKIALQMSNIEISPIALKAAEMAGALIERRKQKLMINVPSTGLEVLGDPDRLAQVFANLLTNASKYSGPETEISMVAGRSGANVVLRVRDAGIGIAPDMIDKVFESFVQEDQPLDRASGGLGLGLSIVRSLVLMHGGRVRALSEGHGKGSEFIVELPGLERASDRSSGTFPVIADPSRVKPF